MAHNITFHLPACAVHTGVQQRDSASIAEAALVDLRTRPLLARCECDARTDLGAAAGAAAAAAGGRLSMRFAPAAPARPPAAAAAPPTFTFASMLGGGAGAAAAAAAAAAAPAFGTAAVGAVRFTVDGALCGVSRIAPQPVADVALSWRRRVQPATPPEDLQCGYVDQYTIGDPEREATGCCGRFCELLHGTLFSNVIPHIRTIDKKTGAQLVFSALLGKTGHYERFSAWSHIAGFFGFAAYAIVRQIIAENRSSVEGVFATVAAWTVALVFFASALYHGTAADPSYAMVTRFIDFAAIYIGLALGATADIAVATRGFENVPVVTIVDIPIAALVLVLFFVWRRVRLSKDETWLDDYDHVPENVECSLGRGLFSRGHGDLHHSQLREATSFLLTASYFMSVPAAVMTLGGGVAAPVIGLQSVGFVLLVGGLLLDKVLEWPNGSLVRGKHACCYPNSCGCVMTAHGVWHLIALVSALCTVIAREYALHSY